MYHKTPSFILSVNILFWIRFRRGWDMYPLQNKLSLDSRHFKKQLDSYSHRRSAYRILRKSEIQKLEHSV